MKHTKHFVSVEFRYNDTPSYLDGSQFTTKTIGVGIFDTIDEAVKKGNDAIKVLAKHFEVRHEDQFYMKGIFGIPDTLVTNCCYPTRGIQYFAKIEKIEFDCLEETIKECFKAADRLMAWRKKESEKEEDGW